MGGVAEFCLETPLAAFQADARDHEIQLRLAYGDGHSSGTHLWITP